MTLSIKRFRALGPQSAPKPPRTLVEITGKDAKKLVVGTTTTPVMDPVVDSDDARRRDGLELERVLDGHVDALADLDTRSDALGARATALETRADDADAAIDALDARLDVVEDEVPAKIVRGRVTISCPNNTTTTATFTHSLGVVPTTANATPFNTVLDPSQVSHVISNITSTQAFCKVRQTSGATVLVDVSFVVIE